MQSPPEFAPLPNAPRFYISQRQTIGLGSVLFGAVAAFAVLSVVSWGLRHNGHLRRTTDGGESSRSPNTSSAATPNDDDDDPNQIDTIVLGDPADAPVPGRKGDHVSPVHATIVVRLPRFGDQTGLIPDSPAGHLLYRWLAAFNQASPTALAEAVPTSDDDQSVATQMELRRQTGGFELLSAKEVEPGLLVFRLRSQTTPPYEVLGTLQQQTSADHAGIASLSLRAVPPTQPHNAVGDTALPTAATPQPATTAAR